MRRLGDWGRRRVRSHVWWPMVGITVFTVEWLIVIGLTCAAMITSCCHVEARGGELEYVRPLVPVERHESRQYGYDCSGGVCRPRWIGPQRCPPQYVQPQYTQPRGQTIVVAPEGAPRWNEDTSRVYGGGNTNCREQCRADMAREITALEQRLADTIAAGRQVDDDRMLAIEEGQREQTETLHAIEDRLADLDVRNQGNTEGLAAALRRYRQLDEHGAAIDEQIGDVRERLIEPDGVRAIARDVLDQAKSDAPAIVGLLPLLTALGPWAVGAAGLFFGARWIRGGIVQAREQRAVGGGSPEPFRETTEYDYDRDPLLRRPPCGD